MPTPHREPETRDPGQITATPRRVLARLGTKVIKVRGAKGRRRGK